VLATPIAPGRFVLEGKLLAGRCAAEPRFMMALENTVIDVAEDPITQCINALRRHLTEYGWVVAKAT